MLHRRPTCLVGDWRACVDLSDTSMPAKTNRNCITYIYLRYVCWSPMVHVGFRWVFYEACQGLRSGKLSPIRHLEVSDQVCWSPIILWSGKLVSDEACRGLWSGILVSDEECRGLWWVSDQACQTSVSDGSPIGFRWVFDNNNIFVNSLICRKHEKKWQLDWSFIVHIPRFMFCPTCIMLSIIV